MLFLNVKFEKYKQIQIIFCITKLFVWENDNIYCDGVCICDISYRSIY